MAEKRKQKIKKREKNRGDSDEPNKEEYKVAKFLRFNCPAKTAMMGNEIHYFTASKAIDTLLNSKKFSGDGKNHVFPPGNRSAVVYYLQNLLDKGLFFRAKKLVPKRKERPPVEGEQKNSKGENTLDTVPGEKIDKNDKKKSKKCKFDMHPDQVFKDTNDIYVWNYDPTSTKNIVLGLAMVVGSIGLCLFPLWPPEVRLGVYYLSVAAMVFVGVIIFLVILRFVLFACVWALTIGQHHFWLLPHLTDDCGFFDSFKPLYEHKKIDNRKSKIDNEKIDKIADEEEEEENEENDEEDDDEPSASENEGEKRKIE